MTPIDKVECDVAVVGAGPAGAACAHALSRGGLRVVLLEKEELPRYKTCGGGLLTRTLDLLPLDVSGVVESECFTAQMHDHGVNRVYSTRRDRAVVSMVMRDRFDHLLARAAEAEGTQLLAGEAVRDIIVGSQKIGIRTTKHEVSAGFVVGADGMMSLVARKAGFPELRDVVPALECELEVDPATFARFGGIARFDFGITPRGYGWVFPKKQHLSVGVLTTRRGCCNLNFEYKRYVQAIGLDRPISEERHGFMIPGRPRDRLFSQPRVFLIGDAAGLADPVTAEGISAAVLSGSISARSILAHRDDPCAAMKNYRKALEEALLTDLRIARLLARGLYDFPKLRSRLFARQGQRLSEFVTEIVSGRARYRDALRKPVRILRTLLS